MMLELFLANLPLNTERTYMRVLSKSGCELYFPFSAQGKTLSMMSSLKEQVQLMIKNEGV